jgi:hypothetical protein
MSPASCKETHVRLSLGGALFTLTCGGLVIFAACSLDTANPSNTPCSRFASLSVGDTIRDSLIASSCRESDGTYENLYRFSLAAQTKLKVSLSSPLAQAFLHVTDTVGILVVNSAYSAPLDTAAALSMILKAGTYYLGVNSVFAAPSGRFRMITAVDNSPVAGCGVTWVTAGISTNQTITGSDCTSGPVGSKYYYHPYRLVILSGGELKLTEHSAALSPMVWIVGLTGATVGASAIDSTGTNARVDYFTGGEDLLLLWVGSSDSLQTGAYSLTIQ